MKFNKEYTDKRGESGILYFMVSKPELHIMMDLLMEAKKRTPKSLFTQPLTCRINSMAEEISKTFKIIGVNYPIRRSRVREILGPKETF